MSEKQAYQLQQWQLHINDRMSSGQTIKEWCNANDISQDAYYYWLRKIRGMTYISAVRELPGRTTPSNAFVEIRAEEARPAAAFTPDMISGDAVAADQVTSAVITKGAVRIEIMSGASPAFLRDLLEAVRYV